MRSSFIRRAALGAALLTVLPGCKAGFGPEGIAESSFLASLRPQAAAEPEDPETAPDTRLAMAASTQNGPVTAFRSDGHYGISDLIRRAVNDSPSLHIRENRVMSAQAQVTGAKLQFLPTPSVSVEGAVSQNDPSYEYGDDSVTVLRLQQPIWTGGRLVSNYKRAKAQVVVSKADLEHERQGVALSIIEKYGQWLSAKLKRQELQEGEVLYADLAKLILRRIEAGASADSDMLVLQSRVDQLRVNINQLETTEQASVVALSQLVGGPLTEADLLEEIKGPQVNSSEGAHMIEQARARSPLLKRLTAEVQVAEQNIAKARSTLSPEIYVRAQRQYGRFDYEADDPIDGVYVGVQSQLGAGLSNIIDIKGAQFDRDSAKLAIRSGELSLIEQMSTDLATVATIDAKIHNLENAVNSTRDTKESWDRQFVAGRKTWLDVMNAVREHMDMKVQLAEAKATAIVVKWRLRILADGLDTYLSDTKGERS